MCTFVVPSLTNQMVLAYFESLVRSELQKQRDFDFHFGVQEGLIVGLSMQFGKCNTTSKRNPNKSWLQITESIVEDSLKKWAESMSRQEKITDQMDEDIKKAVSKYAMSNTISMADALKNAIS